MTTKLKKLRPWQVEEEYGTPVQTLANWRHLGKGPKWSKPEGSSCVYYDRADLEEYYGGNRKGSEGSGRSDG